MLSAADDPPGDTTAEQFRPHGFEAVDLGDELDPPGTGAIPVDADATVSEQGDPGDTYGDATDDSTGGETDAGAGDLGAAGRPPAGSLDPTQQLTLAADDDTPPTGLGLERVRLHEAPLGSSRRRIAGAEVTGLLDDTLLLMLNAHTEAIEFRLPEHNGGRWEVLIDTSRTDGVGTGETHVPGSTLSLPDRSLLLLRAMN